MRKTFVRKIAEYIELHRDPRTGIAWVEDGTSGNAHSAHPNIGASGNVRGMRKSGYWGKADKVVRCRGFAYNISSSVVQDRLDAIAAEACQCGGNHTALARRQQDAAQRAGMAINAGPFGGPMVAPRNMDG